MPGGKSVVTAVFSVYRTCVYAGDMQTASSYISSIIVRFTANILVGVVSRFLIENGAYMLSVKHIVDPVTTTDLNWVNLEYVKILYSTYYVAFRQRTLIDLI